MFLACSVVVVVFQFFSVPLVFSLITPLVFSEYSPSIALVPLQGNLRGQTN